MGELTELLEAARNGESGAIDRVVTLTYRELRALAHQRLRGAGAITHLDTTSLVNECYLRLVKVGELKAESRAHFIAYAAHVMRSIVVDLVRKRRAQRRGGDLAPVTLDTALPDPASTGEDLLLRLDAALEELARLDERLVKVVEMRYFAGLTSEEIASALGVTERTVRRDWQKARLLLHRELAP
jgi:RNA polymerase sigma factor (TIGR02999 family)